MGANLLITKGNEELVYAQAGMADREAEKPIERNTIFRLYSMTKPITAVAAMILMERGMLDLYEPVADILRHLHTRKWSETENCIHRRGRY